MSDKQNFFLIDWIYSTLQTCYLGVLRVAQNKFDVTFSKFKMSIKKNFLITKKLGIYFQKTTS